MIGEEEKRAKMAETYDRWLKSVVKESLTTETDPDVRAGIECGEICVSCGLILEKPFPGKPRTCSESDIAIAWSDGEFACPSIKRKQPDVAPYLRRRRLANLFGRIEGIAKVAREAMEHETKMPDLESLVYSLENQIEWVRKKIEKGVPRGEALLNPQTPIPKDPTP